MPKNKFFLILHDIRSHHNVGSAFRTADALGIEKIYLTGYTPTPLDRFGRPVSKLAKVALGAERNVIWEKSEIFDCLKKLKDKKVNIIAIEQSNNSIDYKKIKINNSAAFIFGNEVSGLSEDLLNACDLVGEIPMKGKKESLNVSVAVGVALFRILSS